MARYRDDPVGFVENVLGAKPKKWQRVFLAKVAEGRRRISIKAGHGVGKSTAVAWALIWFMFTRYPQKSILTAPTASQLFDALFSEVRAWIQRLPPVLREAIEPYSDRVELKASPDSSFMSARTSSAERPEALAGVHSEHVLLVCDEASAIPEPVFESAAGSMSGHSACTILIGNPTRLSGLFFKTHNQLAADWDRMTVSCLDPDLADLVSPDFVKQIIATYGENSNAYRVRVLGEFPEREDDALIAADLVEAAMNRDVSLMPGEPLVYGLDVARFGSDRTALCKRQGGVVHGIKAVHGLDIMQIVGFVLNEARSDSPENPKGIEINVDSIGLGAGVADRLREQGYLARDVNVAESSAMDPHSFKVRDELWVCVRDWLRQRACKLPRDENLKAELSAPTYTFRSDGRLVVETKDALKKRGMRSPDLADSLCLTFAGQTALVGGRAAKWVPGKPLRRSLNAVV